MAETATLDLLADSSQIRTAAKDLDNLQKEAGQTENAVDDLGDSFQGAGGRAKQFGDAANDSGKKTGQFSRNAGQLGIQVGQLAGQIQGGTSALLAFSQQFADIALFLGLGAAGGVIGGLVAVGAAIAQVALNSDIASKSVEDLADELKELTQAQAAQALIEINKRVEEQREAVDALTESQRRNENLTGQASRNRGQRSQELQAQIDAEQKKLDELVAVQNAYQFSLKELDNLTVNVAKGISEITGQLQASTEASQAAAAAEAAQVQQFEQLESALQFQIDLLGATQQEQITMINLRKLGALATEEERQAIIALSQAQFEALQASQAARTNTVEGEGEFGGGSIFGGGVGTDVYGEQLTAQADALDQQLKNEENFSAQIVALRQSVAQQSLAFLSQVLGGSETAATAILLLQKGLGAAEVFINSQVAATRALAELGPIAGPPAAAKILAYGKISAALIAATGLAQAFSGGGSSPSVTSGGGGYQDSFTGSAEQRTASAAPVQGAQTNVTIQAMDAKSFDRFARDNSETFTRAVERTRRIGGN